MSFMPLSKSGYIAPLLAMALVSLFLGCRSQIGMKGGTPVSSPTPTAPAVAEEFELILEKEIQNSSDIRVKWDLPDVKGIDTYKLGISRNADCSKVEREVSLSEKNGAFSNVEDGEYFICVSAITKTGKVIIPKNNGTRVIIDTSPPIIAIDQSNGIGTALEYIRYAQLTGQCEPGTLVEAIGDGVNVIQPADCSDPGVFSANIEMSKYIGLKTIQLRSTDKAGNQSVAKVTVNRIAPVALISPAQTGLVNSSSYRAAISGKGAVNYNTSLIPAGSSCASSTWTGFKPITTEIAATVPADGNWKLCVIADDGDGSIQAIPTSVMWSVDTTAPAITFTTPSMTSGVSSLPVTGTCESGLAVNVSGTGVAANLSTTCTAGTFTATVNFSNGVGTKAFIVSQTDAAGNIGTSTRNFLRASPVASITGAPAYGSLVATGSYNFGVSGTGVTQYKFELLTGTTDCSSAVFGPMTPVSTAISGTTSDGLKRLCVLAFDVDGTQQATVIDYYWNVDTTPPILSYSTLALTPGIRSFTITGACETGLPIVVTGSGVASGFSGTCAASAFSETFNFSTGTGTKTVVITQTDAAGNQTQVSRDFVRVAPTAIISGAPSSGSIVATGSYNLIVSGVDVTNYKFALLNNTANCTGATYGSTIAIATPVSGTTTDGAKRLCVLALDGDGITQATATEYAWTMDSTVPVAVLTNLPSLIASNATYNITVSGASVITYKFAIIEGASANCSTASYSGWIASATPISGSVTQRDARVCVVARSGALVEQVSPTTWFWQNTVYDAVPVIANNTGLTVAEGASITITTAMLRATDADNIASELTYTISALPAQGQIRRVSTVLAVGATFTQSEIDSGTINYLHTLRASAQSFTFIVRDPLGVATGSTNFSISVTAFCVGAALTNSPFAGGTGITADPYIICTRTQLNAIGVNATYVTKSYRQYLDIDFTALSLTRISSSAVLFTGSYDGRGYNLSNISYGTAATTYNALFASLSATATITNVNVTNATIIGRSNVGILAGKNLGTISSSTVTGAINLSDNGGINKYVGGAVGENWGALTGITGNVTVTIASTATTPQFIGGLVGYSGGTINSCAAAGSVSGSSLTAVAASAGDSYIGGLAGASDLILSNSSSSVAVSIAGTGVNMRAVGGLVGTVSLAGVVSNSYSTGSVTGEIAVGGLIGDLEGFIANSYSTGSVTTTATSFAGAGGLVGRSGFLYRISLVSRSFSSGSVTASGVGGTRFGGLIGSNYGSVEDSYALGSVNAGALNIAGSLIGLNHADGSAVRSYTIGTVTAGATGVGAMVGTNDGRLVSLAWDGDLNVRTTMCGNGVGTGCINGNKKTTAEMKTKSTFTTLLWDFSQIEGGADTNGINDDWVMPAASYPQVTWRYVALGNTAPSQAPATFVSGSGTPGDPYILSTPAHLASIGRRPELMTKSFTLANSIDMSGQPYEPIGHPIFPYSGTFDGAGYNIQNLSFTHYAPGTGLFGVIKTGAIVKNVNLVSPTITAGNGVGAIAGLAFGSTTSSSIQFNSVVVNGGTISALGSHAGGMVGGMYYASADKSGSSAAITLSGGNNRCNYAAGFSGFLSFSSITKSYARGNVTTNGASNGGFYGWGEASTVSDSYATGNVIGLISSTAFPENGCTTVSSWSMIGGFAGVAYTGYGAIPLNRVFATGSTSGGTGTTVAGMIGMAGVAGTWSVNNSFATGLVTASGAAAYVNGLVGAAYGLAAQESTSYFASTGGTGKTNKSCLGNAGTPCTTTNAIDISVGTGTPNYFFSKLNAPLSAWDFTPGTGVWVEQVSAFPKLAWEP